MDMFLGSSQNSTRFRGHFYAIKALFLRQGMEWGYFLGLLKFLIFFGVLDIPDIFFLGGGGGRGWGCL